MELLLSPSPTISTTQIFPLKTHLQTPTRNLKFFISSKKNNHLNLSSSSSSSSSSFISCTCFSNSTNATSTTTTTTTMKPTLTSTPSSDNHHWMVLMEAPPHGVNSKPQVIDYYVKTLERVLGSEKDAQICIYDASWDTHFGFCCDIDEETSRELADWKYSIVSCGDTKHWLVQLDKLGVGDVTKAQMVDYYAQILTKVLGNEKDAQMCIYHVSWQSNFGFCCELDDECAWELAGVPGVLSVQPDKNFESENKDYGGNNLQSSTDLPDSSEASQTTPIKTKKLFVIGLSFYTSEKTLRAAFEGFGELVEG